MSKSAPTLTREALHVALQPPNNCAVKKFRELLNNDSLAVFDEALGYDKQDLSAGAIRDLLLKAGFTETDIPGNDAINDHRAGRRPCRCKG